MYMRSNNNQTDTAQESISSLKTEVAVLKNELEHIKQRAGWVQTIVGALIVGILGWFGLCVVGSAQKTNPVVPTISQR
jgi:predicted phage tail protein